MSQPNPPRSYPSGLPPDTIAALDSLTDNEIAMLTPWYYEGTGEFWCIGFVGPGGKVTKWADKKRAMALTQLERQIKLELGSEEL